MSTSSTTLLYHSAPVAGVAVGAVAFAVYVSTFQFDAINSFGFVAASVPGLK